MKQGCAKNKFRKFFEKRKISKLFSEKIEKKRKISKNLFFEVSGRISYVQVKNISERSMKIVLSKYPITIRII